MPKQEFPVWCCHLKKGKYNKSNIVRNVFVPLEVSFRITSKSWPCVAKANEQRVSPVSCFKWAWNIPKSAGIHGVYKLCEQQLWFQTKFKKGQEMWRLLLVTSVWHRDLLLQKLQWISSSNFEGYFPIIGMTGLVNGQFLYILNNQLHYCYSNKLLSSCR